MKALFPLAQNLAVAQFRRLLDSELQILCYDGSHGADAAATHLDPGSLGAASIPRGKFRASAGTVHVSGAACGLTKASPEGLHTLYWEAFDVTEVCVKPSLDSATGVGAELYFVLVFDGRGTTRVPVTILARAHSAAAIGAASFRPPRFWLTAEDTQLNLVPGSARAYQLVYPCDQSQDGCAYTVIISRITEEELRALARASKISGHVLGTKFELTQAGIDTIRTLARWLPVR